MSPIFKRCRFRRRSVWPDWSSTMEQHRRRQQKRWTEGILKTWWTEGNSCSQIKLWAFSMHNWSMLSSQAWFKSVFEDQCKDSSKAWFVLLSYFGDQLCSVTCKIAYNRWDLEQVRLWRREDGETFWLQRSPEVLLPGGAGEEPSQVERGVQSTTRNTCVEGCVSPSRWVMWGFEEWEFNANISGSSNGRGASAGDFKEGTTSCNRLTGARTFNSSGESCLSSTTGTARSSSGTTRSFSGTGTSTRWQK